MTALTKRDRLEGRVAVVTGAGGGIGSAIVDRLSDLGASIVMIELQEVAVQGRADLLKAGGGTAMALACDISRDDEVAGAARTVIDAFGRCDILVNNAAILPRAAPLEGLDVADWDRTFAVNVRGAFLCAQHFGRPMLAARAGAIVNLGSIAATAPNLSGAYGPGKAAILALTRQIAVEWGPRGVRANSVSPGMIRTPMSHDFYADPVASANRVAAVASRRIGEPDEIAAVVAFLASDAASYVNGQEWVVDGGFLGTALASLQPKGDQPNA